MKHQLGKITPQVIAKALREAEARLVKPEDIDGRAVYVDVKPQDIKQRLELFQPRRPGWGLRTLDTNHVNALATRIKRKGELDPPLVVKFETVNPDTGKVDGQEWVVVDGHHRLAAYQKLEHTAAIRCQWFGGSVRAAMTQACTGMKRRICGWSRVTSTRPLGHARCSTGMARIGGAVKRLSCCSPEQARAPWLRCGEL